MTFTVKQYNSTFKHILIINGNPVAITDSVERVNILESYVKGYDVEINDGAIKKILDKYKQAYACIK